jgi:hypothetical protein
MGCPSADLDTFVGRVRNLRRIRLRWVVVAWYVAGQYFVWDEFLTHQPGNERGFSAMFIGSAVLGLLTALFLAAWLVAVSRSMGWVIAANANALSLLVGQFSIWYAAYGTAKNWGAPLSRLDGLLIALGTLTTAGSFGITPRTDAARGLVTAQLGVDVIASVVIFGLFVARLARWRMREQQP